MHGMHGTHSKKLFKLKTERIGTTGKPIEIYNRPHLILLGAPIELLTIVELRACLFPLVR